MKSAQLALGLLFATAGGVSAAQAQVSADSMIGGTIKRQVDVRATAEVLYDSNIAHTSDIGAERQGVHPSDTVFTPGVSAQIILPIGRQAVFLSGTAGYDFHDKNSQLDHSRWQVAGGGAARLGPCGTALGGSYSSGRSEIDDYTLVERVRNVATTEHVNISITCVRPPGIGIFLTADQSWGQNSLEQLSDNEYETTSVSGGVIYGTPTRLSVSLIGSYSTTEYTGRDGLLQSDGYESWSAGVRLERQLGARIQGSATISYTNARSDGGVALLGTQTEFDGITYAGDLSYRASSRLNFAADFSRNVNPTLIQGGSYEIQTDYGLHGDYRVGSRIIVGLGALHKESNSKGTLVLLPNQLTDSRTNIGQASLRYRQSARLGFTLSAQYEKRKANNPEFNYTGQRVGLAADFAF